MLNQNQVIIRRAEKSDLRALYKMEVECFSEDAYPIHYIARFLKDPRFITMVAILGGRIVGYAAAFLEDSEGGWAGHICSIAVKPEYRRRGIGSRLLETIEEILKKSEVKFCYLEARRDNIAAINFYLKHKYKIVGRLKNYYGNGKDGIVFMKFLNSSL